VVLSNASSIKIVEDLGTKRFINIPNPKVCHYVVGGSKRRVSLPPTQTVPALKQFSDPSREISPSFTPSLLPAQAALKLLSRRRVLNMGLLSPWIK